MDTCMRANSWTIDLRAIVVMPDHVHMIFTPLVEIEKSEVFSLAPHYESYQGHFGAFVSRRLGRPGRVWQTESFDRVLRVSERLDEKVRLHLG